MAWEENVHEETQEVIAEHPQSHLRVVKLRDSSFWPANFCFQCIEGQGGGMKQGGRRTTRDIIAKERKTVNQHGQTKDDAKSPESVNSKSQYQPNARNSCVQAVGEHVRSTELIATFFGNGLDGRFGLGILLGRHGRRSRARRV